MISVALLMGLLIVLGRGRSARDSLPTVEDLVDQTTLLALALQGGMSLHSALAWSRGYVHSQLRRETEAVLRAAYRSGLAAALAKSEGESAPLFRLLARSATTGAAASFIVESYGEGLEADANAAFEARLQRLPVKLVAPLALLMLPGLVVMIAGPALVEVLSQFS